MMMIDSIWMSWEDRVQIFQTRFRGRLDVYGTYDPRTGKAWQVKRPVNRETVIRHLEGSQPLAIYPLCGSKTAFAVADFDEDDLNQPIRFSRLAWAHGAPVIIERSKSKGYHVWLFFRDPGVLAAQARLFFHHLLSRLNQPDVEVFPKHDSLSPRVPYSNSINLPLFGALVSQERTVFLDPTNNFLPSLDQWEFLKKRRPIRGIRLARILASGKIMKDESEAVENFQASKNIEPRANHTSHRSVKHQSSPPVCYAQTGRTFSTKTIPPCGQRILAQGVRVNQRVTCFRLAIHMKNAHFSQNAAEAALRDWAQRNHPTDGKRIITDREIQTQVQSAYAHRYTSYGCEEPTFAQHCDPNCPIRKIRPP